VLGSINFESGSGGNHLRWLLFLDNKFPNPWNEEQTIESKLNFIHSCVYSSKRTWYNWLHIEAQYRPTLDSIIETTHRGWIPPSEDNIKTLYMTTVDRTIPFKHYFHINLGLNSATPSELKQQMNVTWNKLNRFKSIIDQYPNRKIIECDTLFEPMLNKKFYQEVIEFFEFDDHYESAQQIHQWYSQCRIKSARDFYTYFTSDEFSNYLEFMRELGTHA